MQKLTQEQYQKCESIFTKLGEEGLFMSQYELARNTDEKDPQVWKQFLMDPKISDYISSEMTLIRTATMNKMVNNAAGSNSVGQSQLLNALSKLDEKEQIKDGPTFIYSYVPLNNEQKEAPNVRTVNTDGIEITENGDYIMEV